MSPVQLRTQRLCKRFGGLAAVSDISIEVRPREIHAFIGPNGAGKSTLINLLSGELKPTSGGIYINDRETTNCSASQVSQAGIGRTYQKTNIFLPFTVFENARLAAQSRLPTSMRFVRDASRYEHLNEGARAALSAVGLSHCANRIASKLSHGEQRQLEIAMCLATAPSLLLLDEPFAGMGADESGLMVELLKSLARDHGILLVEHDMDAVFQLADRVTVLVNGQLLESGTPSDIRNSAAVHSAYLGTDDHA
ncbi:MAG: ABC transporter ATP-binding protein [Hyphomicrobiales bacterium]|uniref:ABC transporter ATP-binding protein n=1 Tax=Pseudorhodoplanes sp. TaxID=1934341 RepID=UPI003D09FBAD